MRSDHFPSVVAKGSQLMTGKQRQGAELAHKPCRRVTGQLNETAATASGLAGSATCGTRGQPQGTSCWHLQMRKRYRDEGKTRRPHITSGTEGHRVAGVLPRPIPTWCPLFQHRPRTEAGTPGGSSWPPLRSMRGGDGRATSLQERDQKPEEAT